jgi:hypothetical protein
LFCQPGVAAILEGTGRYSKQYRGRSEIPTCGPPNPRKPKKARRTICGLYAGPSRTSMEVLRSRDARLLREQAIAVPKGCRRSRTLKDLLNFQ